MKKFTFFIIAAFMSSFLFSQFAIDPSRVQRANVAVEQNDAKSAWVGGGYDYFYDGGVGHHFFIAGSEFSEISEGNQITKVRFYHHLGTVQFYGGASTTYTNTSYTVKIFENPVLGGELATSGFYDANIGTPVYTQTVVLGEEESGTVYEMTLDEPYLVGSDDFWVAVSFDNGIGAMLLGDPNYPVSEGLYYMYSTLTEPAETFITNFSLGNGTANVFVPLGISLYADDGVANVDIGVFFVDSEENIISEIVISSNESLVINTAARNYGVDATSQSVNLTVTSATAELISTTVFEEPLLGRGSIVFDPFTLTAQQLDELDLIGNFEITLSIPYPNDVDSSDNTRTITVYRDTSYCDLAASFVNNNNERTEITSISIADDENLVIYPMITNNGHNFTNNYVDVSLVLGEVEVADGSLNCFGEDAIDSQDYIILTSTDSYLTLTPADMDELELTGTFTFTFTVTYAGNDNNAANNVATLTVTRGAATEVPVASINTEEWNAGTVIAGNTEISSTFTLTNTGEGTLTVSNITSLAAPWSSNFGEIASVALGAGEFRNFTFAFAPTEEGNYTQDFVINTNGGNITISLSGICGSVSAPSYNANTINVYPNPSKGLVNISVSENSVVKVFDITGKAIATQNVEAGTPMVFTQSAGMYFVQIESNGKVNTKKLIIE